MTMIALKKPFANYFLPEFIKREFKKITSVVRKSLIL